MGHRTGLEVSLAISEAVKLARVDVAAAYPITPQTHIVEEISQMVADGDLDAEFVMVESEHSAMSACCGSAAVGARTFTATAAQGLALMHEILYIASAMRLPIVMAIANRAMSAPISIWGDHSDIMAQRDTGWIHVFAETGQDALDLTLAAFMISEDKRVLLPSTVNVDGFTLSHVIEPVEIPDREEVDDFLPTIDPQVILDPDNPVTMGPVGFPEIYTEIKKQQDVALIESYSVIMEVWEKFEKAFGRKYRPIEHYRTEDAEILLNTAGSIGGTARVAVDRMREEGKKVGLIRTRLWRPYPFEEIRKAVEKAKAVAVVDRCVSFGGQGGPMCSELRSALYLQDRKPLVLSFIAGLGGRDVTLENFSTIVEMTEKALSEGAPPEEYVYIGLRE